MGKAGKYIAKTIDSLGFDSLLKSLSLKNCSIPSDIFSEIFKCLSQCKHLKLLDFGGHNLQNQGKYLSEIIKNSGSYSTLQGLSLQNCSIPEIECVEVLEYLPTCRHLTHLNLSGNKLGKAGKYIAKTIAKHGVRLNFEIIVFKQLFNT